MVAGYSFPHACTHMVGVLIKAYILMIWDAESRAFTTVGLSFTSGV